VSDDAKRAIIELADTADEVFGRKLARGCHSDVGATECPGSALRTWWKTNPVLTKQVVQEWQPSWVSDSRWQQLRDWVKHSRG
jgi:hypothetical protein